jgi:hypothetical protein
MQSIRAVAFLVGNGGVSPDGKEHCLLGQVIKLNSEANALLHRMANTYVE